MRIFILFLLIFLGLLTFLIWKNLTVPKTVGIVNGGLHPCPKSPNCVQSCIQGDPKHHIASLPFASEDALDKIEQFIKANYDTKVIEKTEDYLHIVVITSLCRYRDDLEFLVKREEGIICVRSASRVGYGDGGVNRARIEKLREVL